MGHLGRVLGREGLDINVSVLLYCAVVQVCPPLWPRDMGAHSSHSCIPRSSACGVCRRDRKDVAIETAGVCVGISVCGNIHIEWMS